MWARSDATLKDAFSEMLLHDAGWVTVLDHDDRFLGVLTPAGLLEAARPPNPPIDRALPVDRLQGFGSPKATPTKL